MDLMDMVQHSFLKVHIKCSRINNMFDFHITRSLKDANIETRPVKSNGLWCCILLPSILVMYNILHKVPPVYSLVTYISIGLLCYCTLFIVFISVSCIVLKETIYSGCIASSLLSTLLLYTFLQLDLLESLLFSVVPVFMFSVLLRIALTQFPKTFTVGEAMIVVQGIVLFGTSVAARQLSNMFETDEEMSLICNICFTVFSTVGLIVTALCFMSNDDRTLNHLGYLFGLALIYALIMLHICLGDGFIYITFSYIFKDTTRQQLICFWLCLVIIAACILLVRTKLAVKASTVTRKSFHVLASMVFLTGIVYDHYFMLLAAGIGLGIVVLVEALRKSGIEPISTALQAAFHVYSDEKDAGSFAMTPLYLYMALAGPLLVVPNHSGAQIELLSGVLAVGVGDTAASWFGSRYGFNKWPDCEKTLEGTSFNVLSQLATVYALQLFELLDSNGALIRSAVAATATAFVEAKTEQVDNLILPLIMLLGYQVTSFLC